MGLRASLDAWEKINHRNQLHFIMFYVDDMKCRLCINPEKGLVAHVRRWILKGKELQSIFGCVFNFIKIRL